MFLRANGYSLNFEDDAAAADLFVEVIQGHVAAEALETVLRRELKTID